MKPENVIEKKKQEDKSNNLDRRKINEKSIAELESSIESISDDGVRSALLDMAHIITGDDRFE